MAQATNSGTPSLLFCIAAVAVFVLVSFPAARSQECSDLTADNCCNITDGLNCSFCKDADANMTCKTTCEDGETDTCIAPPAPIAMTCANLTADTCCNSTQGLNCSLCQKPGGTAAEDSCQDVCESGETDQCRVEPTTTPSTPTTPNGTSPTSTPSPATTPSSTTPGSSGGSGQSFDGASFVGGIILSLGIVAIVFFGLKFYKSRKDQNYHTLS
ncbi:hypothetical protein EGW08_008304 [Elysia chlorotica]|uniref:TNFR-Cys domain-containing protein n=1 Tax=Elysia chlorotica TaxID=188477 RepID=A0A433TQR1_ELYCH|nr:hypothetical protein EGW08_008304 [Elysia chlorotica]